MEIVLHQTEHSIGDFESIFEDLKASLDQKPSQPKLQLYPELYLCGYPLQDLCLNRAFIANYLAHLNSFNLWSVELTKNPNSLALIGGLDFVCDEAGLPKQIFNCIYKWSPGCELEKVYDKRLLPNYDIFDEKKYFTAGENAGVLSFQDKNIGLLICEDMWPSNMHSCDPVVDLAKASEPLHLIVNLSASPYHLGKQSRRIERAKEISSALQIPFVYVNRVGGEDEILFDGTSFIQQGEQTLAKAERFKADQLSYELDLGASKQKAELDQYTENSWEELFSPQLDSTVGELPVLRKLSPEHCDDIIQAISFGLQAYAKKNGFKNFEVALSGGIDSALVLCLAKLALQEGQTLEAVFMAGQFSSSESYDLSRDLCKNLGIPFKLLPIKFLHSACKNAFKEAFSEPLEGVADENIQSRLRGLMLYSRANQKNCMALNTSNKSEIAVGYSTQYGDSVGALSLLGDLYKSEIYQLVTHINQKYKQLIPEGIVTRPPTAELRDGQTDEQSLPPYERLDAMLESILSYRSSYTELLELGFDRDEIQRTLELYTKSEFKRFQFCPIIKLKSKSFGTGYRIPLSKHNGFYFN